MPGPISQSPDDPSDQTRIIRRAPTGPIPARPEPDDARTGIIRRAPTGPVPTPDAAHTTHIPRQTADPDATGLIGRPTAGEAATGFIPRAKPVQVPGTRPRPRPSAKTAVAACVVAMLSGWTTSVVATDLITGWWDSDRLFCVAVAFLAFVFAASTICGVVLLLLGRSLGRYLIAAGAAVALLAFGGVFIAGAKIPWLVYTIPVLPVISAVLALHPSTKRWARAR